MGKSYDLYLCSNIVYVCFCVHFGLQNFALYYFHKHSYCGVRSYEFDQIDFGSKRSKANQAISLNHDGDWIIDNQIHKTLS